MTERLNLRSGGCADPPKPRAPKSTVDAEYENKIMPVARNFYLFLRLHGALFVSGICGRLRRTTAAFCIGRLFQGCSVIALVMKVCGDVMGFRGGFVILSGFVVTSAWHGWSPFISRANIPSDLRSVA